MISITKPVGDPQYYFQRWIAPRVAQLSDLGLDPETTYERLFDEDHGDDFRTNTWLREVYDGVHHLWSGNSAAIDFDALCESLAKGFSTMINKPRDDPSSWRRRKSLAMGLCNLLLT